MRDELLALLETGPESQSRLAGWLQHGSYVVGRELVVMAAAGLVKRVWTQGQHLWALAAYQPAIGGRPRRHPAPAKQPTGKTAANYAENYSKAPNPELLTRIENVDVSSSSPVALTKRSLLNPEPKRGRPQSIGANVMLDRQLGIVEPVSGTAVCAAAGCGTRFTPDREAERFCSERCRLVGPPGDRRTVVVDGVEYEATSVGAHPLSEWPADARHGSSLSGACEVKNP